MTTATTEFEKLLLVAAMAKSSPYAWQVAGKDTYQLRRELGRPPAEVSNVTLTEGGLMWWAEALQDVRLAATVIGIRKRKRQDAQRKEAAWPKLRS